MRNSVRLQREAQEQLAQEIARDRARDEVALDVYRDYLAVLEENRKASLASIDSHAETQRRQVNAIYDGTSEWMKAQIVQIEAHIRDLDGTHKAEVIQADDAANVSRMERARERKAQ